MAPPPLRAWVLVLTVACAVLLLHQRPADASVAAPPQKAPVSSGAAKPKCVPGAANEKACRLGVGHDPENQEEEGGHAFTRTMAPAGAPDSDDDYSDPDIPDNDKLEVVGH